MTNSPPNILFIQTDQLTPFTLSAYGDKISVTPNIDHLAAAGLVFENAYCNFPLCAPSRFSMASGQLASKIGAYDNGSEFPASVPTYAHYLRAAGYRTCLSGKMHFVGPDQLHGFEERLTSDIYPSDFLWTADWGSTKQRDVTDTRALSLAGQCARSVQIDYDDEVAFKAERFLYDLARGKDKRPFFLQVSFTHPHDPYLCTPDYWNRYDHDLIPMPSVREFAESDRDPHSLRLLEQSGMLRARISQSDVRNARRAYYGSVSYIDDHVGRLLGALDAAGFSKNTVIVFASDHGEMLGERGMWLKKNFFEPSLRIPLIVHAPFLLEPRRVSDLVSLVDLLPTFMRVATGQRWNGAVEDLDGEDLVSIATGEVDGTSRAVFAELLCDGTAAPIFMIRRGRWKFISSSADPDQLFDLDSDPQELTNLARSKDLGELLQSFRQEVDRMWDAKELSRRIVLSQGRRLLIHNAMLAGLPTGWDFGEAPDSRVPWFRGRTGYNDWAFDFLHIPE